MMLLVPKCFIPMKNDINKFDIRFKLYFIYSRKPFAWLQTVHSAPDR